MDRVSAIYRSQLDSYQKLNYGIKYDIIYSQEWDRQEWYVDFVTDMFTQCSIMHINHKDFFPLFSLWVFMKLFEIRKQWNRYKASKAGWYHLQRKETTCREAGRLARREKSKCYEILNKIDLFCRTAGKSLQDDWSYIRSVVGRWSCSWRWL